MSFPRPIDPQVAWRKVSQGLLLKAVAALTGLAGLVFLHSSESFGNGLLILAVGVLLDFFGRMLCSAAPLVDRRRAYGSVGVQTIGICSMAALVYVEDAIYRATGIVFIVVCQIIAAFLFTRFLQDVARTLLRPDMERQVDFLRTRLSSSVNIILKTGILVASVIGLFYAIAFTMPLTLLLFIPTSPFIFLLLLIPAAILVVSLVIMFFTYELTVLRVREAIINAGREAGGERFHGEGI